MYVYHRNIIKAQIFETSGYRITEIGDYNDVNQGWKSGKRRESELNKI